MLRICAIFLLLFIPNFAFSHDASDRQSLDILWVCICAILVFFMQSGFALLESGLSRSKNAVNTLMKNYVDVCLVSIGFWALGYGLMFGTSHLGILGTDLFFLQTDDAWITTQLLYQMMFAATAVTICSGAMAERTRFPAYIAGALIIGTLIYPIFGSWVWNENGWLANLGFIDFAGSTVVHSIGGWCALAGALVIGPRTGRFDPETGQARLIPGHNLTLVLLGGFILWLGWFGFNGGSTLALENKIGPIILNTHFAACAGALGAILYTQFSRKRVLLSTTVNGSLAGLVSITAGCANMTSTFALLTGILAGMIASIAIHQLEKLKIDDVVGAIGVHGIAGAWGTLAAGLFYSGDLFNIDRVMVQIIGIVAAFLWAFPLAYITYFLIDRTIGLRSNIIAERRGLDYAEHNEIGYPEFIAAISPKPKSMTSSHSRSTAVIDDRDF